MIESVSVAFNETCSFHFQTSLTSDEALWVLQCTTDSNTYFIDSCDCSGAAFIQLDICECLVMLNETSDIYGVEFRGSDLPLFPFSKYMVTLEEGKLYLVYAFILHAHVVAIYNTHNYFNKQSLKMSHYH